MADRDIGASELRGWDFEGLERIEESDLGSIEA